MVKHCFFFCLQYDVRVRDSVGWRQEHFRSLGYRMKDDLDLYDSCFIHFYSTRLLYSKRSSTMAPPATVGGFSSYSPRRNATTRNTRTSRKTYTMASVKEYSRHCWFSVYISWPSMCSALWTLERLDLAGAQVLGVFCWVKACRLIRDETDGNHEANGLRLRCFLAKGPVLDWGVIVGRGTGKDLVTF